MHEYNFVEAILRNVKDREDVREIVLEVGELVGISPGHLKEHMGERFDWRVDVLKKEARVKCGCGFVGRPRVLERLHDLVIFECAECGGIPEVLEGKDIKIIKVVYG